MSLKDNLLGLNGARLRRWLLLAAQVLALVAAVGLAWHGYRLFDKTRANFDDALVFYGLALAALCFFAWDGRSLGLAGLPSRTVRYVREHPVELSVFLAIVAVATFARFYRYGTLPPHGFLTLEEHINGGVAWEILQGDRPMNYALVRSSVALGMWLLGPSTDGLRLPSVVASLVMLLPFYLLMREMVQRPAALFATALVAALRVFGDVSFLMQVPVLVSVLFVFTLVRGLKTGNPIWFVSTGLTAALLSYEYEPHKAVPLFAAAYLGFFVARQTLAAIVHREDMRQFFRRNVPRVARIAVAIAAVLLIGITPMLAEQHRGDQIYFGSLHRQEADRQGRGQPTLLAPNAEEQLRWAAQVFTPFVKPTFVVLGQTATRGVIDKTTSVLIWVALAAAVAQLFRGHRLLFVIWFVGGMAGSALLLANFAPWKVVPFIVPTLVLIGYLVDDILSFLGRLRNVRLIGLVVPAVLVAIIAVIFYSNMRTLNANSKDVRVLAEYDSPPSQLYAICDYLRTRPENNYSFVSQRTRFGWGFARLPGDVLERRVAWSDWKFVCWGLRGEALADLQEAWPFDSPVQGPVTLLALFSPMDPAEPVTGLQKAFPELGEPAVVRNSPGGGFRLVAYQPTGDQLKARQGLWLVSASSDSASDPRVVRIVEANSLPPGPFELTGLAYLPVEGEVALSVSPGYQAQVWLDGRLSSSSAESGQNVVPAPRVRGWHLVSIRGTAPPGLTLSLSWVYADGSRVDVGASDTFALENQALWTHTRRFEFKDEDGLKTVDIQRYDFDVHPASIEGLHIVRGQPLPRGAAVIEDTWTAVWDIANTGSYTVTLATTAPEVSLQVDGETVLESRQRNIAGVVNLAAGRHQVTLAFSGPQAAMIGGWLTIRNGKGEKITFPVSPY